jgi:hypothetical protein
MTYARLSQRTNQWMKDVRSWVSEEELEQIKRVKEDDISISLWVRRAIKKTLSEAVKEQKGVERSQVTNQVSNPNTNSTYRLEEPTTVVGGSKS